MEGFDQAQIEKIPRLSRAQILRLLQSESKRLEVTVSLVNLLYNIVKVGSVPVSEVQRKFFNTNSGLVLQLLGKGSLQLKKRLFENNIPLVRNIAASCQTVAGL